MVNVPGGSKACGNCKRRKVKCDECRPACKRCEKARLVCDGYALPLIRVYGSKTTVHLHFISALVYREVLENDILRKGQPWVMAIMAHERTGVASQAASALAAVHFAGLYDCSAQDMAFARMQYAGAIQTLSKNLADRELSHDVGNTAAVLFLFWCEIATGAMNGHAYTQHNEGLARVVEHIGPHGHQTWLARKNYNMSRMNIIFFALQQRKRTFLEHSDWKTIPWSKTWIPKTPMQNLLDIAADVPGLLEDADTLQRQGICHGISFLHKLFQDRILSTLQLLCQWRLEWHCLHPEAAFVVDVESHLHRTLLRTESPTLPTSIWFHDFARAHEIAIYNALLIVLLDLALRHVDRASVDECISATDNGRSEMDKTPLLLPYPGITTREIAEEVFRTVNYFLHGEHRASGALAVYYALWACQIVFNPDSDSDDGSLWERLRLLIRNQPQATDRLRERAAR